MDNNEKSMSMSIPAQQDTVKIREARITDFYAKYPQGSVIDLPQPMAADTDNTDVNRLIEMLNTKIAQIHDYHMNTPVVFNGNGQGHPVNTRDAAFFDLVALVAKTDAAALAEIVPAWRAISAYFDARDCIEFADTQTDWYAR